MKLPITHFLVVLIFIAFTNCSSQSNEPATDDSTKLPGWNLVWSDEFNYNGLPDIKKWGYDVADPGWVNEEAQAYYAYRQENSRVKNGKLIIEARKDNYQGKPYSSARLVTKNKGDWTYGRIEVRAKLPYGRGTWPAIWMLPTVWNLGDGSWPDNGEIDIMEHVGYDPGVIHASIHCDKYVWTNNTQKTATVRFNDAMSAFHTYAMEWDSSEIKMFVDSTKYFSFKNENKGWQTWPFYKDFHLILNIAIGGSWGGAQGIDNTIFPQRMEVEYVRVYEKAD
ncbi:MAG: glycoside hydrolase family 16 protein [Bacteroidota bacterium]